MIKTEWRFSMPTLLILWIVAGAIAVFMSMQLISASYVDGHYIPVGNDSFYHARRILDAAIGERGFYQFDSMIHAPEGSWLTWPWAYDYLAAKALSLALLLNPAMDPMAFVVRIPVAWVLVNTALLGLICRQLGLSAAAAGVSLLAFALLPLTQNLHGIGFVDHHFLEQTFVFATILTGLRFFDGGDVPSRAVALGLVLGAAPAFHNGLFVLQLPVLAAVFVLWLRSYPLHVKSLRWLAATLALTTLAVVLPSGPFLDMQFEFYTLSWFHLYIATCSACCFYFASRFAVTPRHFAALMVLGVILILPMLTKLLTGTDFLSGDLILLDQISEVRSPLADILTIGGVFWAAANFSILFYATPFIVLLVAWRAWCQPAAAAIYLALFAAFGVTLMLTQFRLHPFGSWVFVLCGFWLIDDWIRQSGKVSPLAAAALMLLILAVTYQPPLRYKLFQSYAAGLTKDYAATRSLFPVLADACRADPGNVLSYNDDGHYIRFHTDCAVLTNNFLISPQHEQKILAADRLLQMTPEAFLRAAPEVKYLFVRMYEIFTEGPEGVQPVPLAQIKARNAPLFVALTFDQELPAAYELLDEVRVDDERNFAYARVFRLNRSR